MKTCIFVTIFSRLSQKEVHIHLCIIIRNVLVKDMPASEDMEKWSWICQDSWKWTEKPQMAIKEWQAKYAQRFQHALGADFFLFYSFSPPPPLHFLLKKCTESITALILMSPVSNYNWDLSDLSWRVNKHYRQKRILILRFKLDNVCWSYVYMHKLQKPMKDGGKVLLWLWYLCLAINTTTGSSCFTNTAKLHSLPLTRSEWHLLGLYTKSH